MLFSTVMDIEIIFHLVHDLLKSVRIVASKALQSRTKNQVFYTQSYDRILEFQVI